MAHKATKYQLDKDSFEALQGMRKRHPEMRMMCGKQIIMRSNKKNLSITITNPKGKDVLMKGEKIFSFGRVGAYHGHFITASGGLMISFS